MIDLSRILIDILIYLKDYDLFHTLFMMLYFIGQNKHILNLESWNQGLYIYSSVYIYHQVPHISNAYISLLFIVVYCCNIVYMLAVHMLFTSSTKTVFSYMIYVKPYLM